MKKLDIDMDYVARVLLEMLEIPSPTGYTDHIVRFVCGELDALKIPYTLTRRGAIRAEIAGRGEHPVRAILGHVDTLGAMVSELKENGRVCVAPIGTWSSRWAEGARVTVMTDSPAYRGTLLPLKASGHVYNTAVDEQKIAWENLEVRLDERCESLAELTALGVQVGDFIAIEPEPRLEKGFLNSRHLDDKAGVAAMLGAARAICAAGCTLQEGCVLLFTISEEVGSGASTVFLDSIAELLAIDNATPAPGQNSSVYGVTIAMMDSSGPFDFHLTHALLGLARAHGILHRRDVFKHYRCDAASAVEAGNDIRTALLGFGLDASHGYERVHLDSIRTLGEMIAIYMQSPLAVKRDISPLGPLRGFPTQPSGEF